MSEQTPPYNRAPQVGTTIVPKTDSLDVILATMGEKLAHLTTQVDEVHKEVKGVNGEPSQGEKIRTLAAKVQLIWTILVWGGTLYTTVLGIVLGAWALHFIGPQAEKAAQPPVVNVFLGSPPPKHK